LYDAYGVLLQNGDNLKPTGTEEPGYTPAQATSLLYAGEYFDTSAQQYYLRARWYDPSNGRFNQLDPYAGNNEDPQSLHKYLYCHANPVNEIDPSGMMEFSFTGLTISMAIGATIGAIIGGVYAHYTNQSVWKGILIGAGIGAVLGAAFYLLFTGITSGALQRFFWNPRTFKTISQQYWRQFGPANGGSLHHWLIPQRWSWIPQGIRNAGFNLLRLPNISMGSLGLNQWIGFALRWGGSRMIVACLVENGIRILIPVTAYATYHAGKWIGNELAEEAIELAEGGTATPIQLNQEEMHKMQDDTGEALLKELE
jgi:RHS repeat-associated protein